jgi:hypothetical protein
VQIQCDREQASNFCGKGTKKARTSGFRHR